MEDHGFNGLNANPHHYRDMFFPVYAAMHEARQGESSQPTQSSIAGAKLAGGTAVRWRLHAYNRYQLLQKFDN
jgi:hypothetical protein